MHESLPTQTITWHLGVAELMEHCCHLTQLCRHFASVCNLFLVYVGRKSEAIRHVRALQISGLM